MSKLVDYNSPEKEILLEVLQKIPMMDNWIASVIENFIYAYVEYTDEQGILVKYKTKYGLKDGEETTYYPISWIGGFDIDTLDDLELLNKLNIK